MGESNTSEPLSAPPPRRWLRLGVRLLFSLIVLGMVLSWVGFDRAREGLERVSLSAWLAALLGFLSLQAGSALKWRFLIGAFGARISVARALRCHALGLFANLCLPSLLGGDVLRIAFACKGTNARFELVLASLCDRLADLSGLLTIATLGFLLADDARSRIGGPLLALPLAVAFLVVGASIGFLVLVVVLRRRPIHRQPRKLQRLLIAARRLKRNPSAALLSYGAAVVLQAGFVLVNVLLGRVLGLEMELGLWFLLWPLAKVAAMLPLGFGGLGVREAAFAGLLLPLGLQDRGVVQSLVWQSVLIAGGFLCGLAWTLSRDASESSS